MKARALNVCCVKWGTLYGAEYVNILYDMFLRNLAAPFAGWFLCFTDDPAGLHPRIEMRALPPGLKGWWNKLFLFNGDVFAEGERVLYFDLDTIFVGGLDRIAAYDGTFIVLRDFYRADGLQSSVMAWEAGRFDYLWREWDAAGRPEIAGGDQSWIEQAFVSARFKPDIWQTRYPGEFVSYKVDDCAKQVPASASVVVFHGRPRPHEVASGWMPQVWKIGGLSGTELDAMRQSARARRLASVEHCLGSDFVWLTKMPAADRSAVICGGPSGLSQALVEIRGQQERGHEVFSVRDSLQALIEGGVVPDAHIVDEAPIDDNQVTQFLRTRCYVSSQAGVETIGRLEGGDVVVYHGGIEGLAPTLENDPRLSLTVGGSAAWLQAMIIAYAAGHRTMHVYGFDESQTMATGHAVSEDPDAVMSIDVVVGAESFKSSTERVTQAREFAQIAPQLVRLGCAIKVHGTGLLPAIARGLHL